MSIASDSSLPISVKPIQPLSRDRWMTALGMLITATLVGIAIDIKNGQYDTTALWILSFGLLFCVGGIALIPGPYWQSLTHKAFTICLLVAMSLDVALRYIAIMNETTPVDSHLLVLTFVTGGLALLCLLPIPRIKHIAVAVMIGGYLVFFGRSFPVQSYNPSIDVFEFQQVASAALARAHNPYTVRFPNIYNEDQTRVFYGPGVVDDKGFLTYGFPYPPLTLLMVLPGYLLGGDCRYAHLIAVALSAALMAYARPGRLGAIVAALFLLAPRGMLVLDWGWTEPVLLLNFSLAMFCACRWRKGLPYALGLFFATKQYSILALPVLLLLVEGPARWRQLIEIVLKAGAVAVLINLPFFLWNPHAFWRAVVSWQFVQPFRMDALSYLVWLRREGLMPWLFDTGDGRPRMWIPFAAVAPAVALCLWRCTRSPAGFAAAVTLISLVFFALNKQAFCNYYFFVLATACWSMAAMRFPGKATA